MATEGQSYAMTVGTDETESLIQPLPKRRDKIAHYLK
jgi:hypothetical protein